MAHIEHSASIWRRNALHPIWSTIFFMPSAFVTIKHPMLMALQTSANSWTAPVDTVTRRFCFRCTGVVSCRNASVVCVPFLVAHIVWIERFKKSISTRNSPNSNRSNAIIKWFEPNTWSSPDVAWIVLPSFLHHLKTQRTATAQSVVNYRVQYTLPISRYASQTKVALAVWNFSKYQQLARWLRQLHKMEPMSFRPHTGAAPRHSNYVSVYILYIL